MTPEKFKEIRMEHKLTQIEFARELGVGVNTVRRYEAGESKIPVVVIRSVALLDLIPPTKSAKK